jgi:hypothetical protein
MKASGAEWRGKQLRIIQRTERDVLRLLVQTRLDINAQLAKLDTSSTISAQIRRSQIMKVKRVVAEEQATLWRDLGDLVRARRLDAAANVYSLGAQFDKELFQTLAGLNVPQSTITALVDAETAAAKSSLDRMIRRVFGESYVNLSQRVYKSSVAIGRVLDNKINSALARGLSAKEFARELSPYINPDTPGGLRYASMRLARSEINNAAHAVAVSDASGKPWIEGMQWELSASHPKADVCDDLAEGGPALDGVYPPHAVPGRPHPQCFCVVTPVSVSDQAFLMNLAAGNYDSYAEERGYLKAA